MGVSTACGLIFSMTGSNLRRKTNLEEPAAPVDIPEVNEEVEDAVDDMIDQKDIRAASAKFKLVWAAGVGK